MLAIDKIFHTLSRYHSLADIDECIVAALNGMVICDDESMLCIDTDGSFTCVCPQGTEFIDRQCRQPGK